MCVVYVLSDLFLNFMHCWFTFMYRLRSVILYVVVLFNLVFLFFHTPKNESSWNRCMSTIVVYYDNKCSCSVEWLLAYLTNTIKQSTNYCMFINVVLKTGWRILSKWGESIVFECKTEIYLDFIFGKNDLGG